MFLSFDMSCPFVFPHLAPGRDTSFKKGKEVGHFTSPENSGKVSKIRIKELIIFWVMQQACLEDEHCLRLVSAGFFPGLRWPFGFGDYSCPGT